MDQDDKVVVLKIPVTPGEAASVPSGPSEEPEPSNVHPSADERTLPVGALSRKLAAQEPTAPEAPPNPDQALGATQAAADVHTAPVPDIKVPPRDTCVQPAEPPRGRKMRLAAGACAVLLLGWLVGLNTPSVDIDKATIWMHQGVGVLNSAVLSAKRGLEDRFEQLTRPNTPVMQASAVQSPEKPNNTDALESAARALTIKLDQVQVSSEGVTRDLKAEVERLRVSVERRQAELASKLTQVIERVERMEQPKADRSAATVPQKPEQVAALSPTVPAPPTQRSAPGADAKPMSPPPPEVRREQTVIKQWTVREVLNGMALVEGPRGLIGVSPGQTVPGVGRVESIIRQGNRWVVATSNGVIMGREGPR